jgi:hypothetical protein
VERKPQFDALPNIEIAEPVAFQSGARPTLSEKR